MDDYTQSFAERLKSTIVNSRDVRELRKAAMIALEMLQDEIEGMPADRRAEYLLRVLAELDKQEPAADLESAMAQFYREIARRHGLI